MSKFLLISNGAKTCYRFGVILTPKKLVLPDQSEEVVKLTKEFVNLTMTNRLVHFDEIDCQSD